jgi:hypothetical protein
MKRAKLQRLEVYVDPALARALGGLADMEDRTVSNYVARVLAEHVEAHATGRRRRKDGD